jgi:hypothetical protein
MATQQLQSSDLAFSSENAFLTSLGQGLSVTDVVNDMLLLLGIPLPSTAPQYILARCIHDMNAAFQMIWALAKQEDYFSRQTLTLIYGPGVSQMTLSQNVLTNLGPARLQTGQPLRPVSSRGMFDGFGPMFLGSLSYSVSEGTPLAFFLEKLNQAEPDNVENILHIVPPPSASTTILIDVSVQPPRYEWNDYVNATPVEFPQLFADSVLLPFCRYKAMTSLYFTEDSKRPGIVEDYQTALRLIGAVDPSMKEVTFAERSNDKG